MPPHIASMDSNSLMNPYRNRIAADEMAALREALALQIALMVSSVGGGMGGRGWPSPAFGEDPAFGVKTLGSEPFRMRAARA